MSSLKDRRKRAKKDNPKPRPKKKPEPVYFCAAGCGYRVAGPDMLCGECACEDDGYLD